MSTMNEIISKIEQDLVSIKTSTTPKLQQRIVAFELLDSFSKLYKILPNKRKNDNVKEFLENKNDLQDIIVQSKDFLSTLITSLRPSQSNKDLTYAILKVGNIINEIERLMELYKDKKPSLNYKYAMDKGSSRPRLSTIIEDENENENVGKNENIEPVKYNNKKSFN